MIRDDLPPDDQLDDRRDDELSPPMLSEPSNQKGIEMIGTTPALSDRNAVELLRHYADCAAWQAAYLVENARDLHCADALVAMRHTQKATRLLRRAIRLFVADDPD